MPLLRPIARGLRRFGVDSEEFFAMIGVTATDDDARASVHRVDSVLELIARKCNVPHIGVALGRAMPVGTLGMPDVRWNASATLISAMLRMVKHIGELTDTLHVELHPDGVTARVLLVPHIADHPTHFMEMAITLVAARLRHVLGDLARVTRVRFRHRSTGTNHGIDAFFGVNVEYGATEDSLEFPVELLREPLLTADPELLRMLREHPRPQKTASTRDALLTRARSAIVTAILNREPAFDVNALAHQLAVSTRSLQRRLHMDGTSFSDLFDEVRRELAMKLLEEDGMLLAEMAEQLGFGSLTSFHRAFRRWTGETPRSFQRLRTAS